MNSREKCDYGLGPFLSQETSDGERILADPMNNEDECQYITALAQYDTTLSSMMMKKL
jgi:hypothetical protein